MTWFKISCRNIRKCVGDYVVYFFTLILGVAIFYIFNAIGNQAFVGDLSESGISIIKLMMGLLEGLSVAVAFVLGFLIIYANNFLIKRRKKEFGLYLLLGMDKKEVSAILLGETVLVGLISLAAGLVIGVVLSQFVSIIIGKFFEADMSVYRFTVSGGSIIKTVINFTVMYLIVLLFNAVTISRYRLITLFSAGKRAEKQVLCHPLAAVILFILSVLALGEAYYRVAFCTEQVGRTELILQVLLGIVATFSFIRSLAGFLLKVLQKVKGVYLKNLNSFVVRQFSNSLNTSVFSISVIALMLFLTICAFSSGFSVAKELQDNIRKLTPVDFSIEYDSETSCSKLCEELNFPTEEWTSDLVEIPVYTSEQVTFATSLGSILDRAKEQFPYARWNTPEEIICVSDYNRLAEIYGQETISLHDNEYAVVCDFLLMKLLRDSAIEENIALMIGNTSLEPASSCREGYVLMSGSNTNMGVILVPDDIIDREGSELTVSGSIMSGSYAVQSKSEKREIDIRLDQIMKPYTQVDMLKEYAPPAMVIGTAGGIRESNNGMAMLVTFLVIYIGIVFLIASAALLALKLLSEAIDSAGRFMILKKIGTEEKSLCKALFAQTFTYFALPMTVAVIHSFFGLQFIRFTLKAFAREGMLAGAGITMLVLIVLYGGYMLATYNGSKRIMEL